MGIVGEALERTAAALFAETGPLVVPDGLELAAASNKLEELSVERESVNGAGLDGEKPEGPLCEDVPPKGELKLAAEPPPGEARPPEAEEAPPARPLPADDILALPPPVTEELPKAEDTACSQSLPRGWSSIVATRGVMCPK